MDRKEAATQKMMRSLEAKGWRVRRKSGWRPKDWSRARKTVR